MGPSTPPRLEAQEDVNEERHPDLPFYGVGRWAKEVGQLQRLFHLFEKDLDLPATAVEVRHASAAPLKIVGQEDEDALLAVEFHPGRHAAQYVGVVLSGVVALQHDEFILDYPRILAPWQSLFHPASDIVLCPGHEGDTPLGQLPEVGEFIVALVEEDDLALVQPRAKLPGPSAIVLAGRVDDDEARQHAAQGQPHVALGRGLAPPMFGPIQAGGHQLDYGCIDHVDRPMEAPGESLGSTAAEGREGALKVAKYLPEEVLSHGAVPGFVGVTEVVSRGRARPAHGPQRRRQQNP